MRVLAALGRCLPVYRISKVARAKKQKRKKEKMNDSLNLPTSRLGIREIKPVGNDMPYSCVNSFFIIFFYILFKESKRQKQITI